MGAFTPLDEFGFHHVPAGTRVIALVIFASAGCSSCRTWQRLLAAYCTQHPDLALCEVDAGYAQALAREFNVFHLPALLLYRDGHFHSALQSETHPDKLRAAIEATLTTPAQEAP
jgi:thioredoxin-like negative regulator of GroEL